MKTVHDMSTSGDGSHAAAVGAVLEQYRAQRNQRVNPATLQLLLRGIIRDGIGPDAALRAKLLIEAASGGHLYVVRELLRPMMDAGDDADGEATATHPITITPPPVSIYVTDERDNNILHLAVLSGKAPLVRWLLQYALDYDSKRREFDLGEWMRSLNGDFQTPFNLAIGRGNMRILNAFLWFDSHRWYVVVSYLFFDLQLSAKRFGFVNELETLARTGEGLDGIVNMLSEAQKSETDDTESRVRASVIGSLAVYKARRQANPVVRNAVDSWARYFHLDSIEARDWNDEDAHSLSWLKETFGGHLHPWWDEQLSSLDIVDYISNRSENECEGFFHLLRSSIEGGHFDSAMWLLTRFKAPPSLISCKKNEHGGLWYLRFAPKVVENALFGWVDGFVKDLLESTGDKARDLYGPSCRIVRKVFGSYGRDSSDRNNFFASQLTDSAIRYTPAREGDQSADLGDFWESIWKSGVKDMIQNDNSLFRDQIYDVDPKIYVAVMQAGRASLSCFEESGHGELITHFLQNIYRVESGFMAADLPRLSYFVALDLKVFFQYLTKRRRREGDSEEFSFLDLNLPLLIPASNASAEASLGDGEANETSLDASDDAGAECCICLEPLVDPFKLTCGHHFHHQCLFRFTFPALREMEDSRLNDNSTKEEQDILTHQVLTLHRDLSFKLGMCTCPYCRQTVKPSLDYAFALNLLDGLKRTAKEKRFAPQSPNLDIEELAPGITIGKVLLGFAASSGAINIFQWLVQEEGIQPDSFNLGGKNVLYYALANGHLLIIRWLCENGFADMLYGGLQRQSFDEDEESSQLTTVLDDEQAARIDFFEREIELRSLRQDYNNGDVQYSETEKAWLMRESISEAEVKILNVRRTLRRRSPMHQLLLVRREGKSVSNAVFRYLKGANKLEALPKNWFRIVLTCGTNNNLRDEAKRFISQQLLVRPIDLDASTLNKQVVASCLASEQEHRNLSSFNSIVDYQPDPLSLLDLANDINEFNLWRMFARGETDWRSHFRVARSCQVWQIWSTSEELCEDLPTVFEDRSSFIREVVINGGCVEMLGAFCTMSSFGKAFDFLSDKANIYSGKESLRVLVRESKKYSLFDPLFQLFDRSEKASSDIYLALGKTMRSVASGKTLVVIREDVEALMQLALSLPNSKPPFGVDYHEKLLAHVDPVQWDWLVGNCYIDGDTKENIKVLLQRRDGDILRWVFSLVVEKARQKDDFNEVHLVLEIGTKLAAASLEDCFGLEEFVSYFVTDSSSMYYENREQFLVDQLGSLEGQDKASQRGMLKATLDHLFYASDLSFRKELSADTDLEATVKSITNEIEARYCVMEWFLSQRAIGMFLAASADNKDRFSKAILANRCLTECSMAPYLSFRVMKLFFSYGVNAHVQIEDEEGVSRNLVEYIWKMHNNAWSESKIEDAPVIERLSEEGDNYKTKDGNVVKSARDVIRWLVLDVGVDIQHMHYNDVKRRRSTRLARDIFASQEEWDALKEEQREMDTAI